VERALDKTREFIVDRDRGRFGRLRSAARYQFYVVAVKFVISSLEFCALRRDHGRSFVQKKLDRFPLEGMGDEGK
jgi:hypothetical protein